MSGSPAEPARVLAHGLVDGHTLEFVQEADGSPAILRDGQPLHGIDWRASGLDGCMRVYLGMLRHRPPADA